MTTRYSFLFLLAVLGSLLLGNTPSARAQFLWQRAIGTATRDETAEFMVPVAGGFVTLGKYSSLSSNATGLFLTKVNYRGDTIWTKRQDLPHAGVLYPRGLIVDAAGNLVASVISSPPPPSLSSPSLPLQGQLVKFTPTGDTLWTRLVPSSGPNESTLTVLVLGNDGSYVAIGELSTLPALFKFSPAGALLWTQIVFYDNARNGYLQNLVAVPTGYLLFASSNTNLRGKYILVDEQGAFQRERLATFYGPSRLERDSQGNVFALGGGLTKLTAQGDSVWTRSYQQFGVLLAPTRLVELPGSRYLLAGQRYNGPTRDVGLAVVDRNGALLRDTLLVRYNSDENVAGVGLTPAGDYVVAYGASQGPIGRADQMLFAYRNWNRLLPAATRASALTAQLAAYPNPTADAVTLEAADGHPLTGHWTLYDMVGRAVQTGVLPGVARPRISLAEQPAGLYLLRLTDTQRQTTQTLRLEKA
ncbi:T9SS type A sorting domain-containing protein [Hymenobacter rubidus]|uniref:T9SS type A sorting domain-containing protein n=1 Tax=Hymenobacter rubidus TaxID=1441626 RepID=UPI00191D6310|nr:T9SS type A sorting domain-containing protein [Hymenobacter rubidus]